MGEVYKRGKIWYLDFRVDGRRKRIKVGTSKEIALLALKDAEGKVARKEFGLFRDELTVIGFFDKFREYSKANHSPATVARYSTVIDNFQGFLAAHPHIVKISSVSPELIELYKMYRREDARTQTINFELKALKAAFYLAVKWDHLKTNPVVGVKNLRVTDAKPTRSLTVSECSALFRASPEPYKSIFQTFVATGMRSEELKNLEWNDVDLSRRVMQIRRKAFWGPKTEDREVPINSQLLPILRRLRAANSTGIKSNFVFPHKDGGKIKLSLRTKLGQFARVAGIKDMTTIHGLRHTFASTLIENGVTLPVVQQLMGHTDIKTTMLYSHVTQSHLVDAVDTMTIEG